MGRAVPGLCALTDTYITQVSLHCYLGIRFIPKHAQGNQVPSVHSLTNYIPGGGKDGNESIVFKMTRKLK